MTGQPQAGAPSGQPVGIPSTAPIRIGLTVALVVAVVAGVLFYRSLGPFDKTYFVMIPAEVPAAFAILFLITLGGPTRRTLAAALACLAAIIPSCEGLAVTYLPVTGPSAIDNAHPSPLDQMDSLLILLMANFSVMAFAIRYAKGNRIVMLMYVGIGVVGGIALLRLIYK